MKRRKQPELGAIEAPPPLAPEEAARRVLTVVDDVLLANGIETGVPRISIFCAAVCRLCVERWVARRITGSTPDPEEQRHALEDFVHAIPEGAIEAGLLSSKIALPPDYAWRRYTEWLVSVGAKTSALRGRIAVAPFAVPPKSDKSSDAWLVRHILAPSHVRLPDAQVERLRRPRETFGEARQRILSVLHEAILTFPWSAVKVGKDGSLSLRDVDLRKFVTRKDRKGLPMDGGKTKVERLAAHETLRPREGGRKTTDPRPRAANAEDVEADDRIARIDREDARAGTLRRLREVREVGEAVAKRRKSAACRAVLKHFDDLLLGKTTPSDVAREERTDERNTRRCWEEMRDAIAQRLRAAE